MQVTHMHGVSQQLFQIGLTYRLHTYMECPNNLSNRVHMQAAHMHGVYQQLCQYINRVNMQAAHILYMECPNNLSNRVHMQNADYTHAWSVPTNVYTRVNMQVTHMHGVSYQLCLIGLTCRLHTYMECPIKCA